jgi:hypothetical protein
MEAKRASILLSQGETLSGLVPGVENIYPVTKTMENTLGSHYLDLINNVKEQRNNLDNLLKGTGSSSKYVPSVGDKSPKSPSYADPTPA